MFGLSGSYSLSECDRTVVDDLTALAAEARPAAAGEGVAAGTAGPAVQTRARLARVCNRDKGESTVSGLYM